jgi:hypothetical protein
MKGPYRTVDISPTIYTIEAIAKALGLLVDMRKVKNP